MRGMSDASLFERHDAVRRGDSNSTDPRWRRDRPGGIGAEADERDAQRRIKRDAPSLRESNVRDRRRLRRVTPLTDDELATVHERAQRQPRKCAAELALLRGAFTGADPRNGIGQDQPGEQTDDRQRDEQFQESETALLPHRAQG